jgi:hypothetical protein
LDMFLAPQRHYPSGQSSVQDHLNGRPYPNVSAGSDDPGPSSSQHQPRHTSHLTFPRTTQTLPMLDNNVASSSTSSSSGDAWSSLHRQYGLYNHPQPLNGFRSTSTSQVDSSVFNNYFPPTHASSENPEYPSSSSTALPDTSTTRGYPDGFPPYRRS